MNANSAGLQHESHTLKRAIIYLADQTLQCVATCSAIPAQSAKRLPYSFRSASEISSGGTSL